MRGRLQIRLASDGAGDYPRIVLEADTWDDFGLKTLFKVQYHRSPTERIDLGSVKIFQKGQHGKTKIPENGRPLPQDYCSLGQQVGYYEALLKLPRAEYDIYLKAMRDAVYDPIILENFKNEPGFNDSLVRSTAAETAMRIAPALFSGRKQPNHASRTNLHFRTFVGGNPFVISFDFGETVQIPSRINAVIGYNASGKTQMLANLAMVAATGRSSKDANSIKAQYGEFLGDGDSFGSVIAISYSAFDTFDVPVVEEAQRTRVAAESDLLGYSYCGLRDLAVAKLSGESRLKSFDELAKEFEDTIRVITERDRRELFYEIVGPLVLEASFQRIGVLSHLDQSARDWGREFSRFSSGHKIVLSIAAHLAARLQKESLVIIDEPEAHLHPPLLAALLKSVRIALKRQDSYGVIATHSPVVLQETPAKFVRVMRRMGNSTSVIRPQEETFGENIGILTRDIFSLSSSNADFRETLGELAETMSDEGIEELFGGPLGFQARSYVESIRRMRRLGQQ